MTCAHTLGFPRIGAKRELEICPRILLAWRNHSGRAGRRGQERVSATGMPSVPPGS